MYNRELRQELIARGMLRPAGAPAAPKRKQDAVALWDAGYVIAAYAKLGAPLFKLLEQHSVRGDD
jgi:hypothetical protein